VLSTQPRRLTAFREDEFRDSLIDLQLLKKDCSIELVI